MFKVFNNVLSLTVKDFFSKYFYINSLLCHHKCQVVQQNMLSLFIYSLPEMQYGIRCMFYARFSRT